MQPSTLPSQPVAPVTPPPRGTFKQFLASRRGKVMLGLGVAVLVAAFGYGLFMLMQKSTPENAGTQADDGRTHISIATIWSGTQLDGIYDGDTLTTPGLRHYLEEYEKLNPTVKFDIQTLYSEDYFSKLIALHDADSVPDIYQAYAPWGETYVKKGMLAKPPEAIVQDVRANYVSAPSTDIGGQTWGIPTEINDYMLVYNKKLFAEAGIAKAPATWADLLRDAQKLTKKDAAGNTTQVGFAFARDDDELIGDTFLSMLASNEGSFTAPDGTSAINNTAAVEVLTQQVKLFQQGSTNAEADLYDFTEGRIGMVVVAPWVRSQFQEAMGEDFADVAVAPLPILKKRATLQYSWFTGVMEKSKHKEEAWKFLQWFTAEAQPATGTTRSSDLLAANIGTIPSRREDAPKESALKDEFMTAFVNELPYAVKVPSLGAFADARSVLSKQVQAAWGGGVTPQAALDKAAADIDKLLKED